MPVLLGLTWTDSCLMKGMFFVNKADMTSAFLFMNYYKFIEENLWNEAALPP